MIKFFGFLILFVTVVFAADAQCLLRVHMADNSQINIAVNGRYFDKRGTTVTVGDLPPGRHHLKVYNMSYDRWGRRFDRLAYQGYVNTQNGMITNFLYDPGTRRIAVRSNRIDDRSSQAGNDQYRSYSDDGGRPIPETQNVVPNDPPMDNRQEAVKPASGRPVASPAPTGSATDGKYAKLKAKTEAKGTDTDKLKYLKDALKKEVVTTDDVSDMLDWFLFESTKVEFAIWAYSNVTDKDAYPQLEGKFNYDSSKEELQQFLETKR